MFCKIDLMHDRLFSASASEVNDCIITQKYDPILQYTAMRKYGEIMEWSYRFCVLSVAL